jgi:hypothetical protein
MSSFGKFQNVTLERKRFMKRLKAFRLTEHFRPGLSVLCIRKGVVRAFADVGGAEKMFAQLFMLNYTSRQSLLAITIIKRLFIQISFSLRLAQHEEKWLPVSRLA